MADWVTGVIGIGGAIIGGVCTQGASYIREQMLSERRVTSERRFIHTELKARISALVSDINRLDLYLTFHINNRTLFIGSLPVEHLPLLDLASVKGVWGAMTPDMMESVVMLQYQVAEFGRKLSENRDFTTEHLNEFQQIIDDIRRNTVSCQKELSKIKTSTRRFSWPYEDPTDTRSE
ncbi:hypothetical protein MUA03_17505 [Enterobacteriaceae bacterium H16N7]|nr:hypothetical protein [Dryocola clanedunensis]